MKGYVALVAIIAVIGKWVAIQYWIGGPLLIAISSVAVTLAIQSQ
jgi:hypothetical protein